MIAVLHAHASFFDPQQRILMARAPGRLDIMGGIADYSGSLVLELPIGIGAWFAVQPAPDNAFTLHTTAGQDYSLETPITLPIDALTPPDGPLGYEAARAWLTSDPRRAWGGYVAGALVVLHRERGWRFGHGLRCLLYSKVPIGKGLGSSAAIEVATLRGLTALAGLAVGNRDLALLAQRVENLVVGAACGVMDQMTSTCGRAHHVLALLCQPAEVQGNVPLPADLEVWGIDSGIRHAVTDAEYSSARVAAFMGYRMVIDAAGLASPNIDAPEAAHRDVLFRGHLANVSPSLWHRYRDAIPPMCTGRSFLDRYRGTTDGVTRVEPERAYAVRACTEHPIAENHRVRLFLELLRGGASTEDARALLGELMMQSHLSYSACGLGADGTDRLVELVREQGPAVGVYGARISAGGSGGTVAVLARTGSRPIVVGIADAYRRETGRYAAVYGGSSSGATQFGVRRFVPA